MALDDVLQELINEGERIGITGLGFLEWLEECKLVILANFSDKKNDGLSQEVQAILGVTTPKEGIRVLKSIQGRNTDSPHVQPKSLGSRNQPIINIHQSQTQNQTTSSSAIALTQLSLQINLNIEHCVELSPEQRQAAKDLYKEVETEVQKPNANWIKVTDLLRKSFDYGLKIAPDIVRLADAYYKAKGGA